MRFSKSSMMIRREKKRKLMDVEIRKSKRKNKRMRMDDDATRSETKDNFSVMQSMDTEQTPKKSLILLPELPNDLLDLIICNLELVDRFHLGLACKSFFALVCNAIGIISAKTKFGVPCFLSLAMDRKTCSLSNYQHEEKYIIKTPSLPVNAEILCAKDGWLLLAVIDQESVFFFNPLTKATIRLPDLTKISIFRCFSFSCPPTSPDCIVIAIRYVLDLAAINTCRRGDEQWTACSSHLRPCSSPMYDYTQAVFYGGSFYCLRTDGILGILDPVKRTFTARETARKKKSKSDALSNTPPPPLPSHYLIVSDGQLLRVVRGLRAADSSKKKETVVVHNLLDHDQKVDNLGDNTFYVSRIASLSSKTLSASCRGKVCGPKLPDFYEDDDRYYLDGCWIEPDCTRSSPEELQWTSKT